MGMKISVGPYSDDIQPPRKLILPARRSCGMIGRVNYDKLIVTDAICFPNLT